MMKYLRSAAIITAIVFVALPLAAFAAAGAPLPPAAPTPPTVVPKTGTAQAAPSLAVTGESKPGTILEVLVPTTTLSDNQDLGVHVMGTGKTCRFHLIVINTDTNKESYFPQTAKLPMLLHATLSANLFPHGNYKVTALAWDSDKTSGIACLGGGAYKEFKITRQKLTLAAETPTITDLTIKAGKSPIVKTYRSDETIGFTVLGNVDNLDPKNTSKKCGWTLLLSDDKGASIKLKTGATFNSPQTSEGLTAFKPGNYTLTAKTTSNDDGLAPQSCLGKASKEIAIIATPGQIKDVKLEAWGVHGSGSDIAKAIDSGVDAFLNPISVLASALVADNGVLRITPIIDGATCLYRISRVINGSQKVDTPLQTHKVGGPDKLPVEIYSKDETTVQVTIHAGDLEKASPLGCEGSVTKTIVVRDNPKLAKVVK